MLINIPDEVTFDAILKSNARIAFTALEVSYLVEVVNNGQRKGRDYYIGFYMMPHSERDLMEMAQEGVMVLTSPHQLDQCFAFVKCDAGRSLFGRQKAVYRSFLGEPRFKDRWMAGPTFKTWMLAATSVGNVYRGSGLQ